MERPEFNELKKLALTCSSLIVNIHTNGFIASVMDGGKEIDMCVVFKHDNYTRSKKALIKRIEKANAIYKKKNINK